LLTFLEDRGDSLVTTKLAKLTLSNGVEMPALGLGVYRSGPEETLRAVSMALAPGYRLIATAAADGKEAQVGEAIRQSGGDRGEASMQPTRGPGNQGRMSKQHGTGRDELLAQQGALARFGELALGSEDLDEILREACHLVGGALGTDLAKVTELQPDGRTLLVRAGVGWRPGVVGEAKVDIEGGPEGLALRSGRPVVSTDLAREDRFEAPDFVKEHGVQAIVCVPIIGVDGGPPFGVLQVDSRRPQGFDGADVSFLRTYANMLSSAVARLRAAAELRRRAEENERLLRELQHRVKNNLQVMVGLVEVQARKASAPEAKGALRAVGRRVEALRLLHDKLHLAGEVDRVDLGDYLGQLAGGLLRFHEGESMRIRLVLEVERGLVASPDQAAPLGLVVNEFVTNSLKHAFGDGRGAVGLRLEAAGDGELCLALWDDGKGLPRGRPAGGGTGMRMVENLARQLGARASWGGDTGARLELTFPHAPLRPVCS
jgi:two-component sensor histidine kinase